MGVQSFGGRKAELRSPVEKKGTAYKKIDIFAAIKSSNVIRQAPAKSPAQDYKLYAEGEELADHAGGAMGFSGPISYTICRT